EARLDARRLGRGFRLDVFAAGTRLAALPVRQVGLRAALAGAHGRAVDRLLEARRQLYLGGLAPALDDHLRGDVAPGNDGQAWHAGGSWRAASAARRVPSSPYPV